MNIYNIRLNSKFKISPGDREAAFYLLGVAALETGELEAAVAEELLLGADEPAGADELEAGRPGTGVSAAPYVTEGRRRSRRSGSTRR